MPFTAALGRAQPPLTISAIAWWSAAAFLFLCALCLHGHLRGIHGRKFDAQQAQRWREAPALAVHLTYGSARLSGSVPTALDRDRLLRRAREVFGAQAVVDGLQVDAHTVPADWLDTAVSLLWLAGKKLENGAIEFRGRQVRVSGSVADAATQRSLVGNVRAVLSEHVQLDARLTLAPKHANVTAALARLLPPGALQFAPRSAVLTPGSKQTLNRVGTLLRSSTSHVEIVAYADAVGAPALSQRLSLLRADAVRDYLVERGVARQQLRSIGAGEAPARNPAQLPGRRAELRVSDE